jgi:hypothetical protein
MRIAYKYIANSVVDDSGILRDTSTICGNMLFASKYEHLNDPFECSARFSTNKAKDRSFDANLQRDVFQAGIYSLCLKQIDEKFPSNETMWAHYANSHKGFCIAYDLDILEDSLSSDFDLLCKLDVKYQDNSPVIDEQDSFQVMREKLFARKSKAWKSEHETRLIFKTDGLKPIPQNAIVAIYFGLNMTLKERNCIINGIKCNDITYFQIERIPNCYKLKATEIMDISDIDYEVLAFERLPRVDNYEILYKSEAKDKNTIEAFIKHLRKGLSRPSNLNLVDDARALKLMAWNYTPNASELQFISEHWIAMSTFDAPDYVSYYPQRD